MPARQNLGTTRKRPRWPRPYALKAIPAAAAGLMVWAGAAAGEMLPEPMLKAKTVTARMLMPHMISRLKELPKVKSVRQKDEMTISVEMDGDESFQFNLDNLLDRMNDNPARRAADVDDMVAGLREQIESSDRKPTPEQFAASLRLVVRNVSYKDEFNRVASSGKVPQKIFARPLAGDVVALVVEDTPRAVRMMAEGGGAEHDMSDGSMFERATKNMLDILARAPEVKIEDMGSIKAVAFDETYNASLVALPPVLKSLSKKFGEDIVIAIPTRDIFIFCKAADAKAVAAMRQIAEAPKQPYAVTSKLFRWRAGSLEVHGP